MKVDRKVLLEALDAVAPGLGDEDAGEQATAVAFTEDGIATYNDEIAVRHPLRLDFTGAVRAEELRGILGKMRDEEIEISVKAQELQFRAKNKRGGLPLQAEIRLPIQNAELPDEWFPLPGNFMEAVKLAQYSAATTNTRPVLCAVHAKGNVVEAADGIRLTQCSLDGDLNQDLLIPTRSTKHLIKYPFVKFHKAPAWMHFATESGTIFSCRTMDGTFPDTAKVMHIESGVELTFPEGVTDALQRASTFTGGFIRVKNIEAYFLEVKVDPKGYVLITAQGDKGWFRERIPMEGFSGEDVVAFRVHPDFLASILSKIRNVIIGDRSMRFDGDGFVHVVALMALKEPEPQEEE